MTRQNSRVTRGTFCVVLTVFGTALFQALLTPMPSLFPVDSMSKYRVRSLGSLSSLKSTPSGDTSLVNSTTKIFVVGMNKSGTTTLRKVLAELGFLVGEQSVAEELIHDWARRNFSSLVDFIDRSGAQVFQDVPFSLDFTYQALDMRYPGSKFILTERVSADIWFRSIKRFHARVFTDGAEVATMADLKRHRNGWAWDVMRSAFFITDPVTQLYNKSYFEDIYKRHNENVRSYFHDRPEDLLCLTVGKDGALRDLHEFLGEPYSGGELPIQNETPM